jgi:hypothetical protein
MSKKRKDQLTGFGIRTAIAHAQSLNDEHDQDDLLILRCGDDAFLEVVCLEEYMDVLSMHNPWLPQPGFMQQYTGATGLIPGERANVLVVRDDSLGDVIYTIHDEDYQWSVGSWVERR